MNLEDRLLSSETHQFKMIFHNTVNDHDTLFGGTAMQWMDEVAYITATRFTRMKMITVSSEKVEFIKPISCGSFVEIIGKILKVGNVKINIQVEIYTECVNNDNREKAVEALFSFAAIDNDHKPIPLKKNI
jgi:acyl-CoA hydrolase